MFLDDRMDERKRGILRAIIDDYIDTAEPIGSRTVAKKHELGLSSATIRNEMADLEELGYLSQPHTSAGRIPSDKGYRIYVDRLMEVRDLPLEDVESIKNAMEIKIKEMSQLIRQASVVMSRITKYTSMAITPQIKTSSLKAVQVVPIDVGKVLVIVVTNSGIVRNSLVKISENATPDFLIKASNIINDKLSGRTLEQINMSIIKEIEVEIGSLKGILIPILDSVAECINESDNPEIYLNGTTNIFNYPEFKDVEKARELLNVLDVKENLHRLLKRTSEDKGVSVHIGTENELEEIKDCSLITTSYSLGNIVIGSFGIIGPTRMEYPRVISSLNYLKKKINQEINRMMGENLDGS